MADKWQRLVQFETVVVSTITLADCNLRAVVDNNSATKRLRTDRIVRLTGMEVWHQDG
jgi:hypothetical protein